MAKKGRPQREKSKGDTTIRKQPPQSLRSVWRVPRWTLLGSILALIVVPSLAWLLVTCYTERKEALAAFKAASASHRAADDKYLQDFIAFAESSSNFLGYLRQNNKAIDAEVVQQYLDQVSGSARQTGIECNNAKRAFYEYMSHQRNISRLFFVPPIRGEWTSHACAGFPRLEGFLAGPDAKKLAHDPKYRKTFLDDRAFDDLQLIRKLLVGEQAVTEAIAALDARMISDLDVRASSMRSCVMDCLKLWCGAK